MKGRGREGLKKERQKEEEKTEEKQRGILIAANNVNRKMNANLRTERKK